MRHTSNAEEGLTGLVPAVKHPEMFLYIRIFDKSALSVVAEQYLSSCMDALTQNESGFNIISSLRARFKQGFRSV